jgi:hypothetical protein
MMVLTIAFDLVVAGDDFDFHLGKNVHRVFAAAVDFLVALLAAKPLHFGDGHAFDPSLGQSFLNIIEFKRLNDGFNFFHMVSNVFWFSSAPVLGATRCQLI